MSNYTPNFQGTDMDNRPEEKFPVEVRQIENAQLAYREIIEAAMHILKRRGMTGYQRTAKKFGVAIERMSFLDLASFLEHHVSEEMRRLSEAGYEYVIEGYDHEKFFDTMYALLRDEPVHPPLTETDLADLLQPLPNQAMSGFSAQRALREENERNPS